VRKVKGVNRSKPKARNKPEDNKMHNKKGAGTPAPKTRTEGRSRSRRSRRRTRLTAERRGQQEQTRHHKGRRNKDNKM
jgi:hypothetical protein